jgi:hypothetical protein
VLKRLSSLLLWPLLWLALLALPFGSAAAAAMPPCHHAQAQAGAAPLADKVDKAGVAAMHAHAEPAHACTEHGCGHGAGHEHGHCASCGACCAGMALAPAPFCAPPAAGPAFVAIPFRAGHLPSVDPALPERPPRSSFA